MIQTPINRAVRVAFVMSSLNRGGMEVLVLDTIKNIDESHISPICIYRNDGNISEEYRRTGIKLISLKPKYPFDPIYLMKLRKTISESDIDIAHPQQPLEALYVYLACLGLNVKIVLSVHGFDFNYPKRLKRIFRFIQKRVSRIVFVSQSQKNDFQKKYRFKTDSTRVIYNGISFQKFEQFERSSIREEFNIPNGHLLLGSVGNFTHVRDQATICRFLNLLNQKEVPFSFIFAGMKSKIEPHIWDKCVAYCKTNKLTDIVHFPGSRNDVPNILSQLDAFIYSTDHDTFGIAVIEAIASGAPVFVNDWEVINEISENGKRASLYETKNEHDLLEKFMVFAENKSAFLKKAKQDASWAKDTFSIQNHILNLQELYNDIL